MHPVGSFILGEVTKYKQQLSKSQISKYKLQTNLKFQYPMTKTIGRFVLQDQRQVWDFVFWSL